MVSSLFLLRPPAADLSALPKLTASGCHGMLSRRSVLPVRISLFPGPRRPPLGGSEKRGQHAFTCFYNAKEKLEPTSPEKALKVDWPILQRWDVPWGWQTATLTMIACGVSFVLTGLVEASVLPYLAFQGGEVSLEEKAEILFAGQFAVTAVILGVIYGITNSFRPLPDDIVCYDWKDPFSLRNGWLLWAGIGLAGALFAIALAGVALTTFSGENPQRETDALIRLLPLIGSSSISTACLVGVTGVLAPILEETVFRGFLMVSLTKWVPTPVSVLISAAVFAIAHLTPGEFPQLFLLGLSDLVFLLGAIETGAALGFSYAQTRNLLTPITIHSIWNSGVILLLTFLQLQGYDIRELLQAS